MRTRDGGACCSACAAVALVPATHCKSSNGQGNAASPHGRRSSVTALGFRCLPALSRRFVALPPAARALPPTVRAFFEPRLGQDLSHVRRPIAMPMRRSRRQRPAEKAMCRAKRIGLLAPRRARRLRRIGIAMDADMRQVLSEARLEETHALSEAAPRRRRLARRTCGSRPAGTGSPALLTDAGDHAAKRHCLPVLDCSAWLAQGLPAAQAEQQAPPSRVRMTRSVDSLCLAFGGSSMRPSSRRGITEKPASKARFSRNLLSHVAMRTIRRITGSILTYLSNE